MGRGRSTTRRFSRARNKADLVCETALRVAPFAACTGEGKASRMWGRMPITACRAHGRGSSSRNLQHLTRRRSPHARAWGPGTPHARRRLAPLSTRTGVGRTTAFASPYSGAALHAHRRRPRRCQHVPMPRFRPLPTRTRPPRAARTSVPSNPVPAHAGEAFSPWAAPRCRHPGPAHTNEARAARGGGARVRTRPRTPDEALGHRLPPAGAGAGPGTRGRGSARSIEV